MRPPGVALTPMSPDELAAYLLVAADGYRDQRMEFGGETEAQAQAAADRDFAELFPGGEPAPDQHLFIARDANGDRVGRLWVALRARTDLMTTFVYDIEVDPEHRRQGWGRAIMAAARVLGARERRAADRAERLRRQIAARALYLSIGYTERAVTMAKDV